MLRDAVEAFLASLNNQEHERGSGSRNTNMAYRNDINQLCRYVQGQGIEEWSQVHREMLALYLLQLREGLAYRPTTIARKIAALKSFFRFLVKSEIILCDPIESLETPRVRKELPQIVTPEQIGLLFQQVDANALGGIRDLAMLHMLYATGMRASEIVALNLNDFNARQAIVICSARSGVGGRDRILPLTKQALDATIRYLDKSRPFFSRNSVAQDALFLNHHGERLTRQGFWLIIKGYARQAGITAISPHMLRHSFAFLRLQEGMDLNEVKELLGHAHLSTTQIYSQLLAHAVVEQQEREE